MLGVAIEIRRCVDASYPGWIECRLIDARGREWLFVEKVPVITRENLDADSTYPRPGVIACEVVARRLIADGREVVRIDTEFPWHVEATSGDTSFEVWPEQLRDLGRAQP